MTAFKMNLFEIEKGVNFISSQGGVLSTRELACLTAGMAQARISEKFSDIFFWGRISADEDDYYICYGLKTVKAVHPNKKFLWT